MRRSIEYRPLIGVIMNYFLFWLLHDVWVAIRVHTDAGIDFFLIGLAVCLFTILFYVLQWSLLADHVKIWFLFGVLCREESFHKLKKGFCEYLESEAIDVAYYKKILIGSIAAIIVGLSLFTGSLLLL